MRFLSKSMLMLNVTTLAPGMLLELDSFLHQN